MFEFVQQQSFLLGSHNAISALAHQGSARLLVLSDSHGNADVVRAIVSHFGARCDALCFCGDGARDVLSVLATFSAAAEKAACLPPVAALVQGNGDAAAYTAQVHDAQTAVRIPKTQELTAAGKHIFLTHGHLYDVYYGTTDFFHAAKRERADLALFGHTHIPYTAQEDGLLLINPGSCARPRRSSPNSFALVTIAEAGMTYQFFAIDDSGKHFTEYDPPHEEMSLLWQ